MNLSQEGFKVFENEQAQAVATFEPASEPRIAEGKHPSPDLVPAVAMQKRGSAERDPGAG
jgi:hypothetical protein